VTLLSDAHLRSDGTTMGRFQEDSLERKIALKKTITSALVAAAVAAALSACNVDGATNASGTTHEYATSDTSSDITSGTETNDQAEPKYTIAQQNAIESAQSYLDMGGFSRAGLIDQLSSKSGEGFKKSLAVFAVNHIKVNWNKEAVEAAKAYLEMGGFSRSSLIDQLSSSSGERFTRAQATYAANHVGL
jgi:hypothetical protein